MKSMTRFLFVSFLIVAILIGSVSCSRTIEAYKDYRCYDYHLRYLNTSKSIGTYQQKEDNTVYNIDYRKIIGEDETKIIGAEISSTQGAFSSGYYPRVLQNPQSYISVIDVWTIESMQFCVYDITKSKDEGVVFESSDSDDIEAFKRMLTRKDHAVFDIESDDMDGYRREFSENGNEKRLTLRIIFSESENIVWETEIESYFNPSTNERIYAIDLGKSDNEYGYQSKDWGWKKSDDSTLNRLFTEFVMQIDSNS